MRGDALQSFKDINGPTRDSLREILAFFRRQYVKPQSMATAKHKLQKLVFNPANQKLIDFFQKLAKDAFGTAAHAIIEQFMFARMPPHLKKLTNQARLENGTYEQIVTHLEMELELNGLEALDGLEINTVSPQSADTIIDRPEPTCHHCKKPGLHINQCRLLKKQKEQAENNQNNPGKKTVTPITLNRTERPITITITTKTVTEPRKSQKLFIHPVRRAIKQTTQQRKVLLEPMQPKMLQLKQAPNPNLSFSTTTEQYRR